VVVGLDPELDVSSVADVNQYEDRIIYQSGAKPSASLQAQIEHKLDEMDEQMLLHEGLQMRLLVVEPIVSHVLYFICKSLPEAESLRKQWLTGRLRDTTESLYTFTSGAVRTSRVKRLIWSKTDYERCKQEFRREQGKQTI